MNRTRKQAMLPPMRGEHVILVIKGQWAIVSTLERSLETLILVKRDLQINCGILVVSGKHCPVEV